MKCEMDHWCHCGTGKGSPHKTGEDGCVRVVETAPNQIPEKFEDEFFSWKINGTPITDYTLRNQRGYSQQPCGCWTSWNDSTNSLDA